MDGLWFQYKHSLTKEEPFKTVLLRTGPGILPSPTVELIPMQSVAIKKVKLDDIVKQLKYLYYITGFTWVYELPIQLNQPHEPQPEV